MNYLRYPGIWISLVWIVWLISWVLAAGWSSKPAQRPDRSRELPYRLLTLAGVWLLIAARGPYAWRYAAPGWAGLVLVVTGIGFAWWARIYLGKLWSASVTAKADHRVVDSGPYGLVRHPIYTGLLLAVIGSALGRDDAIGWIGGALIVAGTVIKARLEEKFLREQLGAAAYDLYSARVPMLVPLVGWH